MFLERLFGFDLSQTHYKHWIDFLGFFFLLKASVCEVCGEFAT
jgi:hypothetical protein